MTSRPERSLRTRLNKHSRLWGWGSVLAVLLILGFVARWSTGLDQSGRIGNLSQIRSLTGVPSPFAEFPEPTVMAWKRVTQPLAFYRWSLILTGTVRPKVFEAFVTSADRFSVQWEVQSKTVYGAMPTPGGDLQDEVLYAPGDNVLEATCTENCMYYSLQMNLRDGRFRLVITPTHD